MLGLESTALQALFTPADRQNVGTAAKLLTEIAERFKDVDTDALTRLQDKVLAPELCLLGTLCDNFLSPYTNVNTSLEGYLHGASTTVHIAFALQRAHGNGECMRARPCTSPRGVALDHYSRVLAALAGSLGGALYHDLVLWSTNLFSITAKALIAIKAGTLPPDYEVIPHEVRVPAAAQRGAHTHPPPAHAA